MVSIIAGCAHIPSFKNPDKLNEYNSQTVYLIDADVICEIKKVLLIGFLVSEKELTSQSIKTMKHIILQVRDLALAWGQSRKPEVVPQIIRGALDVEVRSQ